MVRGVTSFFGYVSHPVALVGAGGHVDRVATVGVVVGTCCGREGATEIVNVSSFMPAAPSQALQAQGGFFPDLPCLQSDNTTPLTHQLEQFRLRFDIVGGCTGGGYGYVHHNKNVVELHWCFGSAKLWPPHRVEEGKPMILTNISTPPLSFPFRTQNWT